MKTVSVLFTKYSDLLSNFVYHLTGRGYTHTSLSLDNGDAYYYSFNYKGFCRETVEKHRRRGIRRSVQLRIAVSDEAYEAIQRQLRFIQTYEKEYHYTRLGVFCALLHLPFRWHKHYFCSQFVAEMLDSTGAVSLKKRPGLYLPNQVLCELKESPQLVGLVTNVI